MKSKRRFVLALVPAAFLLQGLSAQDKPRPDFGKSIVELPIKSLISPTTEAELALSFNKKVAAGKVAWHANHAAALVAARKSGKPVLHFQLMGKLDQEFC